MVPVVVGVVVAGGGGEMYFLRAYVNDFVAQSYSNNLGRSSKVLGLFCLGFENLLCSDTLLRRVYSEMCFSIANSSGRDVGL